MVSRVLPTQARGQMGLATIVAVVCVLVGLLAPTASADFGIIARSAQDPMGPAIQAFKYVVNDNNVGDPSDPNNLPSTRPGPSHSPVLAAGETDTGYADVFLPPGEYLVSVRAGGFKLGGEYVHPADTEVTVLLHPYPLPLSKIRVHVFHDNRPVNGEDDFPMETGLEGFSIIIGDTVGEVTVDYWGNPLGTTYLRDKKTGDIIWGPDGLPIVDNIGYGIYTDANGDVLIENLAPGKYEVLAVPPDGSGWIQTTTIEGTHVIDAWIEEGNDGYSPREGFKAPLVWVGFVQPMPFANPGSGVIMGTVKTTIEFTPPVTPLILGPPVDRPWVALTDIGGNDQQAYLGRGNQDGSFAVTGVPDGTYQLAIWDEPLDYIISFRTVIVQGGATVDLGTFGIPRWYGWMKGSVFYDSNGNGIRDASEEGIPGEAVATRFKDGSIQYVTSTDMTGSYSLEEVFELERFAVAEVGFTRYAATGATAISDYDNPYQSSPVTHPEGTLTLAELTWSAKTNWIDWGKKEHQPGENGGISGVVYYDTVRGEWNPQFAGAEDFQPGIPGATVNLYAADGITLLNSALTDSWEHPTGCPLAGPGGECLEVPGNSNQIKPGLFDGGYAFTEDSGGNPLPPGTYILEVVPPEGYAVADWNSINTDVGDEFIAMMLAPPGVPELAGPPMLVTDPDSPFYGETRPSPSHKLVVLQDQQNAACDFFLYTEVPVPGRIVGFLLDDVNIETNPARIYYGEKRGIPDTPVGIRDFTGRLITTVHSDINGIFEVLLPSAGTYDVPSPSGVVPGMYLVVGNDPGDPDNPNPNYNPNYQSLILVFDVWPGKTTYADVALFPIAGFVEGPGAQFSQPPGCDVPADVPQVWRLSQPYVQGTLRNFTIYGAGFGAQGPNSRVTLNNQPITVDSWDAGAIGVTVPATALPGPRQMLVTASNGQTSPTGLTIHVLGKVGPAHYQPTLVTVNAGESIQAAINNAAPNKDTLIVVNPGTYYENLILYKGVKVQGCGPGAFPPVADPNAAGCVIDGKFFLAQEQEWIALLNSINFAGNQEVSQGQTITVVGSGNTYKAGFNPLVDGFTITGARGEEGGGIHVNAYGRYLEISNSIIYGNGGGFGGAITLGKAYVGDNQNDGIRIHHNRILSNGGISLAGAIGIFNGADDYEIAYNTICGNYSAEYGGGISHFGYSPGGQIHHNKVLFNYAFDEGGGIFVGGEQPIGKLVLSAGSGPVDIYNNHIQGNLSNDDGGGIRLLQPTTYPINIYNNMVVNNVATDIGGGIALDDASNVTIVNNTIAKNISTATAEDSDGLPHGAGLISEPHSTAFAAVVGPGFSDPVMFNNIFWDNWAYTWDGTALVPASVFNLEVFGIPGQPFTKASNNLVQVNPMFVTQYDTILDAVAFRVEPDFVTVLIVTVSPTLEGDYHITAVSPAINGGRGSFLGISAPSNDYDGDARVPPPDIGADEY